jgi:hypothetical protein
MLKANINYLRRGMIIMSNPVVIVNDEKQLDREETRLIIQMSLFDDLTEEDVIKTKWLLKLYPGMLDIIKNYELNNKTLNNGMTEYDLAAAHGTLGKRETGKEIISDVTANTVILKDKREVLYVFYKERSRILGGVINNIRDPHELMIAKLLFVDGMRSKRAQGYMTRVKRTDDIYPIGTTTFFEKRRNIIKNISNSLKINRELDLIEIDYGPGRNPEGECRFIIMEWQ